MKIRSEKDMFSLDNKDGAVPNLPARLGEYYDAVVPDTLDLAERAKLGVHHFVSIMDEDFDYQMRWTGNPTFMAHGQAIFPICLIPILSLFCDAIPVSLKNV